MSINIIATMAKNGGINNKLLNIPNDLKYFKKLTSKINLL